MKTIILDLKDKSLRIGENGIRYHFTKNEIESAWIDGDNLFLKSEGKITLTPFIITGDIITYLTEMPYERLINFEGKIATPDMELVRYTIEEPDDSFDFGKFFFEYLPIRLLIVLVVIIVIILISSFIF